MTLEEEVQVLRDKVALLEKIVELREGQPAQVPIVPYYPLPYTPTCPNPWSPSPCSPTITWCLGNTDPFSS